MFCTLKYNETDDRSSLERTSPPFLKPKRNLGKVACRNCRSSKLKCTGEPEGCRRCEARKIPCSYSGTAQSRGRDTRSIPDKNKGLLAEGERHALDVSMDNLQKQTYDHQYPTVTLAELESLCSLDSWDTSDSFEATQGSTVGLDGVPILQNTMSGEPLLYMDSPNPFFATEWSMVGSSSPSVSPYSFDHNFTVPVGKDTPQPAVFVAGAKHDHSCFTPAVQIYEMIEVNLVWGPKRGHRDATGDILEHLKLALVACESLLECKQCTMRHEYVMLLISMCRKIAGTLESVYHRPHLASTPQRDSNYPRQGPSSADRIPLLRPSWTSGSAGSDTGLMETSGSDGSNTSSPWDQSPQAHGLKGWCLDADDQHVMLRSLLRARAARLDAFVTRLDKVVPEEGWPAHRGGTRELQERVKRILSL
ncbi:hypothetical protein BO94DRAFT_587596 [Aspergillus sclerotioniger CBS 115572]|uniref:Zn(2)-C6 fungal-type domain-containing protein n=1 Tax=Aspergillus sclerotioniger CBS 115572 TaxID=1450535 RepID=A0A317W5H1_9EURO|nr:hypothetical protein BO94DRAFT_587596 [Aspergillus sclerotioniger CBS 115572]PWY80851.1 hypothetical protein BO94DRAFT_587596 [Aspergillus sclerotioniger CBS 115572]